MFTTLYNAATISPDRILVQVRGHANRVFLHLCSAQKEPTAASPRRISAPRFPAVLWQTATWYIWCLHLVIICLGQRHSRCLRACRSKACVDSHTNSVQQPCNRREAHISLYVGFAPLFAKCNHRGCVSGQIGSCKDAHQIMLSESGTL